VSTTTRPVTHVADVAVKSAVKKSVLSPLLVATGSISNKVPINIIVANPKAST
jgi:hypothetical protein